MLLKGRDHPSQGFDLGRVPFRHDGRQRGLVPHHSCFGGHHELFRAAIGTVGRVGEETGLVKLTEATKRLVWAMAVEVNGRAIGGGGGGGGGGGSSSCVPS